MFGKKENGVSIVKFTRGNDKTVYMFHCGKEYMVAVIDEIKNSVISGEAHLNVEKADILYNKSVFENGLADFPPQFVPKGE